jgi:hypothetical protein
MINHVAGTVKKDFPVLRDLLKKFNHEPHERYSVCPLSPVLLSYFSANDALRPEGVFDPASNKKLCGKAWFGY